MKSTLSERSFQAIYRFLDNFSPIDRDCGALCGAACCLCSTDPTDTTPHAESDENADYSMGLYLMPGEEQMYTFDEDWISWGWLQAEDYDFPDSWHGRVPSFSAPRRLIVPAKKGRCNAGPFHWRLIWMRTVFSMSSIIRIRFPTPVH